MRITFQSTPLSSNSFLSSNKRGSFGKSTAKRLAFLVVEHLGVFMDIYGYKAWIDMCSGQGWYKILSFAIYWEYIFRTLYCTFGELGLSGVCASSLCLSPMGKGNFDPRSLNSLCLGNFLGYSLESADDLQKLG